MTDPKKPSAIDLYSGVGGWSLGLKLAGVDVVSSYERWAAANETNFKNNQHPSHTVDIRGLENADLPASVDFVVGSPPCTQFSLSNRGGSGDIEDGLVDIEKFLSIVDHLKPKHWVMENVPRSKAVLEKALEEGGSLERFRHLEPAFEVFNMADFGLPQRRRRCLIGNINFSLLRSYAGRSEPHTLGDVVNALQQDPVIDPLFGVSMPRSDLFDHDVEAALNEEETRINRSVKSSHPVYNAMPFPDPLDRSVRTITATCTRVSRESVVIEDPKDAKQFRRLTVRERASLQGFPIVFQFYGQSYASKIKMVGNAVPPAFSYFVGHALLGTAPQELPPLRSHVESLYAPTARPVETPPETAGKTYPRDRRFRFAVPNLQLKSGVRFELVNVFAGEEHHWSVDFIFGTSKDIFNLKLDDPLREVLLRNCSPRVRAALDVTLSDFATYISTADVTRLQAVWTRRRPGGTRPFDLLDELGEAGQRCVDLLAKIAQPSLEDLLTATLKARFGDELLTMPGIAKLRRNAGMILAGILVGSLANRVLQRSMPMAAVRSHG